MRKGKDYIYVQWKWYLMEDNWSTLFGQYVDEWYKCEHPNVQGVGGGGGWGGGGVGVGGGWVGGGGGGWGVGGWVCQYHDVLAPCFTRGHLNSKMLS